MAEESRGRVGIVCHPRINLGGPPVTNATRLLEERGYRVWTYCASSEERPGALTEDLDGTRLILSFGGDGTMLWTAQQAAPAGVPVLGVNAGRLGFLTQVQVGELPAALDRWSTGDFSLQARALLDVRAGDRRLHALNDAMVNKGDAINFIRVELEVDSQPAGRWDADGAIVATATGSTAYALSLGGPILHPEVDAVIFMPLNSHSLFNRPLVLPRSAALTLRVPSAPSVLACDGQRNANLGTGAEVRIGAGPVVQLVQFDHGQHFVELLRRKLRWGMPLIDGDEG
jgi:NAD+ kinase